MSLSQHTIEKILSELERHKDGLTATALVERTGYAMPTVRTAISTGKIMGALAKVPGTSPAIYLATRGVKPADGPIVVEKIVEKKVEVERIPYVTDAAQKSLDNLLSDLKQLDAKNVLHVLLKMYHKVDHEQQQELVRSLFNIAEYLRKRDFSEELRVEDIKVRKAK